MNNPNNCATCERKQKLDGDWCYMFRNEPTEACIRHTSFLKHHTLEQIIAMRDSLTKPKDK